MYEPFKRNCYSEEIEAAYHLYPQRNSIRIMLFLIHNNAETEAYYIYFSRAFISYTFQRSNAEILFGFEYTRSLKMSIVLVTLLFFFLTIRDNLLMLMTFLSVINDVMMSVTDV